MLTRDQGAADRGEYRQAAGIVRSKRLDRLRLPLPVPAFANERRDNRRRPCRLGHDCRAGTVYRLVRWPTRFLESWHDRSCDLSRRDADTRHRHLGGDLWHPAGRAAAILMRDDRLRLPLPAPSSIRFHCFNKSVSSLIRVRRRLLSSGVVSLHEHPSAETPVLRRPLS